MLESSIILVCILLGGKKRSSFYYDIWNIKYLRKFKWDDLVGEIGMPKVQNCKVAINLSVM